MNFEKLQWKWKTVKHFMRLKQQAALRKLFSLPQPPIRILLHLWNKIFLERYAEIYRHLLSKCFKKVVLGRQEMVQCKYFSSHQTETWLLENLWTEKAFWLCFGIMLFSISKELRFVKWVRFFVRNCMVKCVIFLAGFYWLWAFLLQILE